MQTLVFNTTTKEIKLYKDVAEKSEIVINLSNIPTVKVLDSYYEVYQKDEFDKQLPVLRLGIQSTNMIIKK